MNINDSKVIELMEQIKIRKNELENVKFTPKTNLILNFEDKVININTLSYDDLKLLACKLVSIHDAESYLISSGHVPFKEKQMKISGYELRYWIDDICLKMSTIRYREDKKELDKLEKKLEEMLSGDKKIELELKNIEEMLKL